MAVAGIAIDSLESLAHALEDPESCPAGYSEPEYPVSGQVTMSRDQGLYVYHVPDDQLGTGSSLGNARAWAETRGHGNLLGLFSIETGSRVLGGLSVSYLLPFSSLGHHGAPTSGRTQRNRESLSRAMPSAKGTVHLHPAFQQHEFVIADGLHVLETFLVPRTGMDDPAAVHNVVMLTNRTPHPIGITVVFTLGLRGHSPRDLKAEYDAGRHAIVAWNASKPEWIRVFGGSQDPSGYWATTDEEEAYNPGEPLPNRTDETGDLAGALQFDMLLLPGRSHKVRAVVVFSPDGRKDALRSYDGAHKTDHIKQTVQHYKDLLETSAVEMPDRLLTHGIQWAKTCLIRPICHYKLGTASTNDPGRSSNLVGRDTAWYVHGCDFVKPDISCEMLRIFAEHQRDDGLIAEYINGNSGETEDYGFNINDNTPLFIMAVGHHVKATGHWDCLDRLYEPARKAAELIIREQDENGLVKCKARGTGGRGICGWRNVLQNEEITGVVTEVNAECYAALRALADLAEARELRRDAARYNEEAQKLRERINERLINPKNGLYVRNIDPDGKVFTQATSDLVFPLICGVSDKDTSTVVSHRLSEPDFMTEAGLRVLPIGNPNYDPSFESGCKGGVWPGVTWWYSMSASGTDPTLMADSLRRAYVHYVSDPKVYNTVPGQFSEWSDGLTLVNRGMRLSPWESPRFLWAAIEGLAGIKMGPSGITLAPRIPADWYWLRVHNVLYQGGSLSFFLTREGDELHAYTPNMFGGGVKQHVYEEVLSDGAETITTGLSTMVLRKGDETLICLGSSLDDPALGPFLAHHSIDAHKRYRVSFATSHDGWSELGVIEGSDLQRIAVRIERQGYALYKFVIER